MNKFTLDILVISFLTHLTLAEPAITDVTARQRYPQGGIVDIAYTMTESVATNLVEGLFPRIAVSATDRATGNMYKATTLSGDVSTQAGRHSIVWDMAADGLSFLSTDVVFSVSCEMEPALYCVIDLSAGSSASSYPVTYLAEPPSGGFNVDAYKTTKLVLRRIDPGTFMMCGQYETTLTKPYYIGVFEMTQKQYALVMGSNPSQYTGDKRPVDSVDRNLIQGSTAVGNWPSSSDVESNSFLGKLRAKAGLDFDLPTEAQWEYACRAGTTSDYNNGGNTEADLKKLGRYSENKNDGKGGYSQHTTVGSYMPNAWGLYDMHGNVWEYCLDWMGKLTSPMVDPKGALTGSNRIKRGDGYNQNATYATSSYRATGGTGTNHPADNGFRLARRILAPIGTVLSDESVPVIIDLPQTTLNWTTGGGQEWAPFNGDADSLNCLKSGAIPDGTNTWMKTVVTGPGKLSFDWKVSCENRYAYLQVLVDGVQKKRITGTKDWESLLYEIGEGEHEVMWNYVKDGASAVGEDAGFVRNISWRPYLSFSSVSAHGASAPADNDALLYGDAVEASVEASVTEGDVRYDCIGWRGTGSAPEGGVSNTCAFVIREDSSLEWLWRTNWWTSVSVSGPASADFAEAWVADGAAVSVAVAPTAPFFSIVLSGDTEGVTLDGTNVVFTATRPRALAVTVTELTYAGAVETEGLAWRTGGDAVWFPQGLVSSDGADAAQSGALGAKGVNWIETVVVGPGTLSFKWRFDAGAANSGIDFLIDGDYEDGLTDATGGFESYTCDIGAGRHVLRWEFYGSDGANGTAWLDAVSWSGGAPVPTYTSVNVTGPATADFTGGLLEDGSNVVVRVTPLVNFWRISLSGDTEGVTLDGAEIRFEATGPRTINVLVEELTFEGALDAPGLKWRTGGDAVWFPEAGETHDGVDAAQSGTVADKGASRLATTVVGPGTLYFQWKLSTGGTRSGIDLLVDGEYEDSLEADTGWTAYGLAVEGGRHEIAWEFWNRDAGTNCAAWIDAVSWNGSCPTATYTTAVPVPYAWLDAEAKSFVTSHYGDYEAAAFEMSANGRDSVWECYVAGISPTNAAASFRAVISWEDGAPEISWDPILTPKEAAKRTYRKYGKVKLTDEDWTEINGDEASYNFFKVSVEMTK